MCAQDVFTVSCCGNVPAGSPGEIHLITGLVVSEARFVPVGTTLGPAGVRDRGRGSQTGNVGLQAADLCPKRRRRRIFACLLL